MDRQQIAASGAPGALGPYSQALHAGNLLFCSGQIGLDPVTGSLVGEDIQAQTRRAMDNLSAIMAEAGTSWDHVVRTTIYLTDLDDFSVVNAAYAAYLSSPFPARTTVQVAALPKGARVEIDAIAVMD